MLDSSSEGLNSVKRPIVEVLLQKKMVHAEQPENRAGNAFKPTNEKSLASFLVDRND